MNKENTGIKHTAFVCLILIALILGIFFHVAFGKEAPERHEEISVVLYSAGTGGWEAFQEGLKRAEDDFSVNVNCVILQSGADAEEQLVAIEREVENGAEGIIVAVADYKGLYKLIQEKTLTVPIVTVESGFGESTASFISADNYEMGKKLGEEILNDFAGQTDLTVALDTKTVYRDSVEQREQGLRDALEGKAEIISLREAANGEGADAAVALHKETLLDLAELKSSDLDGTKKYGIGNTTSIVAALDQGRIEKLVFQNEFNMGYLAVETLLGKIGSTKSEQRKNIDSFCVSSEEIYNTPYEQLLFPIVK